MVVMAAFPSFTESEEAAPYPEMPLVKVIVFWPWIRKGVRVTGFQLGGENDSVDLSWKPVIDADHESVLIARKPDL